MEEAREMADTLKKYMLISVCDRDILTEQFASLEDAQKHMRKEMCDWGKIEENDGLFREGLEENEIPYSAGYGADCAYVNDGVNHADYDWRIVEIE